MFHVRFPLSLRNVEDLLHERGIDVRHEAVRYRWHRFGLMFASEIKKRRVAGMKSSKWRWHLDEMFVKINGERHYLWRAVDHEGEVLESFVTKRRDRKAALKFLRKSMKRFGNIVIVVTDKLLSYGAAMKEIGSAGRQETGRKFPPTVPTTGASRNSFPLMRLSAIISSGNAISVHVPISSCTAPPLWPSGVSLARHSGAL